MLTDWLIVRRLAAELAESLAQARIRDVGLASDGRLALRTPRGLVAIDAFAATPNVTLEDDAPVAAAPGWPRTVADALVGLRIERLQARRGDRLLAFDCAARSRFGVASGYRLVVELTPRFGNVVLLKGDTVVVAAREFEPERASDRRTIVAGRAYEPPPLPAPPAGEPLEHALAELAADDVEAVRVATALALRAELPLLPRLIADSLVAELARLVPNDPHAAAARLRARARALLEATEGEPGALGDVFCYRDGERIVQAHVLPLHQFARLQETREPALVPILRAAFGEASSRRARAAFAARQAALTARIAQREHALQRERATLESERDDSADLDALRGAGELLYAHLTHVPSGATHFVTPSEPATTIELDPNLDAKANAAAIFKRYRKAVARRGHAQRRLAELARAEATTRELAWEIERAEAETLDELGDELDRLERRKPRVARAIRARRRALELKVNHDATVLVGRSPRGNAELTFRTARPDDLWFHARNAPGAHVVLRIDSLRAPTDDELRRAAELAAYHSKARSSEKVAVDYTARKFVRKQPGAAPGLVTYTNARTLLVAPKDGPAS